MQCADWDPVIKWFNERYGTELKKNRDIVPPSVHPATKMLVTKHLLSYDVTAMHGKCLINQDLFGL